MNVYRDIRISGVKETPILANDCLTAEVDDQTGVGTSVMATTEGPAKIGDGTYRLTPTPTLREGAARIVLWARVLIPGGICDGGGQ